MIDKIVGVVKVGVVTNEILDEWYIVIEQYNLDSPKEYDKFMGKYSTKKIESIFAEGDCVVVVFYP